MNPSRFKKIEGIYHDALDLGDEARRSLLDKRCGSDHELRREVEALLSAGSAGGIIDDSPKDIAASLFAEQVEKNLVGARIGKYDVLSVIGEGGMGKVYLALDDELKRKVALKVLPGELVQNADRVDRFVHEARSASALSHPNILTIYEVGESDFNGDVLHFILPETYRFLSESLLGQMKAEEALVLGKRSLALSEEAKNQENIGCAWRAIGKILGVTNENVEIHGQEFTSDNCFANALEIFEESGMKSEFARTLRNSSEFTDNKNAKMDLLRKAAGIFSDLDMEFELEKTRKAITSLTNSLAN